MGYRVLKNQTFPLLYAQKNALPKQGVLIANKWFMLLFGVLFWRQGPAISEILNTL